MPESQFTNSARTSKKAIPWKPHKDFPLFTHAAGRWAKKVLGKRHDFGKWDDPQAALNLWLEQKDFLLAGRKSRNKSDGLTFRVGPDFKMPSKRILRQT